MAYLGLCWALLLASLSQQYRTAQLSRRFDCVVVDAENLRGKSGFSLSHQDLLRSMKAWSQYAAVGNTILAIDHGEQVSKLWLGELGVVFAGNRWKADDCIALDIVPFFRNKSILVVTADRALIHRCKRSTRFVEILAPDVLLGDLEQIIDESPTTVAIDNDDESEIAIDDPPSGLVSDLELAMATELLEVEALLRNRSRTNNRKRKKLRIKGKELWHRLQGAKILEILAAVLKLGVGCEELQELSNRERRHLLARWKISKKHKETTSDRIILAERLRQELLLQQKANEPPVLSPVQAYIFGKPMLASQTSDSLDRNDVSDPVHTEKLKIVVISDTHGLEEQLNDIPNGDLLLHLGDFAIDRKSQQALHVQKFDAWLSRLPHPRKIVLRGNHDPRSCHFFQSGAQYITQVTVKGIAGLTFCFVPYISGGLRRKKGMPNRCDVLVTHVPPHRILDKCSSGKFAGSQTLTKCAQAMRGGPPFLWLCGHIHEARGIVRHPVFCLNRETTVINTANANAGRATNIEYDAVSLTLDRHKKIVSLDKMDGQYVFMNHHAPAFFRQSAATREQALLAVDLGLRTGVSLFDSTGQVTRCEHFHFDSTDDLVCGAKRILSEWGSVSHIAIEGMDPPLAEAWIRAAGGCENQPQVLSVKPEQWRLDLLTSDERKSGESSKATSVVLAQSILPDPLKEISLSDDLAESLLLGLHVSRRLGWGALQDPPIVRGGLDGRTMPAAIVEKSI